MKVKVWSIEIDDIDGAELSTLLTDLGRILGPRPGASIVAPAPVAQLVAHETTVAAGSANGKPGRKPGRKPGPKPKQAQPEDQSEAGRHL